MTMWRQMKKLALIGACVTALAACGDGTGDPDDPGGGGGGGFQGDKVANIQTSGSLNFSSINIGGSETGELRISNTGDDVLKLNSIALKEEGDSDRELFSGENWVSKAEVAPGEELALQITYKPVNEQVDTGEVVIEHNASNAENPLVVPIDLPELEPDISGTDSVNFQSVQENTKAWKAVTIQNAGNSPLKISGIKLGDNKTFSLSYPDPELGDEALKSPDKDIEPGSRNEWPVQGVPTELQPDEIMDIRVWFEPTDTSAESTELQIVSNDPDENFFKVDIVGNAGTPCLGLSHEEQLNFGQGSINNVNTKTMTIENCRPRAEDALEIKNIRLKDDGGGVFGVKEDTLPGELAQGKAFEIVGDNRASFVVTFTPPEEKTYNGVLVIESNDPSRKAHEIKLVGKGSDNQCPNAVAEARVKGSSMYTNQINTLPLETIQFSSQKSQDPDGQISKYEWSILKRPEDSTARLVPGNDRPNPELFLDLAGKYQIELVVYDNDGAPSCGENRALVNIEATPNEDIHVQLVWDTPSDTDQTDDDGADVDLHYLSPKGTWNEQPYDIFWHNKTGDWGVPNKTDDDPSLDIDDTNGAGPENVNHDNPEPGQAYKIGVYYYEDNGFGPSYATVRIYIDGKLKREFKNKFLEKTFYFWYVGLVEWPTKNIYERDMVREDGFPGGSQSP